MIWLSTEYFHFMGICTFPNIGNLWGSVEYGKSLCFPILFLYYVNWLFHILGIVWISPSPKIFKKPINLKCLCFPILFPYYGNPLFLCFWNCMDFCFTQNIWKIHNFQMFVFSHNFPLLWEFMFPMFWGDFCFTQNI